MSYAFFCLDLQVDLGQQIHTYNEKSMSVLGKPGFRGFFFLLKAAVSLCRCAGKERWF